MALRLILIGLMIQFSSAFAKTPGLTETECLAGAIYLEARGETDQGKLAVAKVVLNRQVTRIKPVCDILTEKGQFSTFTLSRVRAIKKASDEDWHKALLIANKSLQLKTDPSKGSTYFQVKSVPHDPKRYTVVAVIGNHKFMRPTQKSIGWS